MKLIHPDLEQPVDFDTDPCQTLVVENAAFFRKLVTQLVDQSEGADGSFSLYEDGTQISLKVLCVMTDLWRLDFSDRKIMNRIFKELESIKNRDETRWEELKNRIGDYLQELCEQSDFHLSCTDEIDFTVLCKACGITVRANRCGAEALCEYIGLAHELNLYRIFVFVNFGITAEESQMRQVCEFAAYRHIPLLFLESRIPSTKGDVHGTKVDEDLCETYVII